MYLDIVSVHGHADWISLNSDCGVLFYNQVFLGYSLTQKMLRYPILNPSLHKKTTFLTWNTSGLQESTSISDKFSERLACLKKKTILWDRSILLVSHSIERSYICTLFHAWAECMWIMKFTLYSNCFVDTVLEVQDLSWLSCLLLVINVHFDFASGDCWLFVSLLEQQININPRMHPRWLEFPTFLVGGEASYQLTFLCSYIQGLFLCCCWEYTWKCNRIVICKIKWD